MSSAIKELMVAELASKLRGMGHAVLVDFTGLSVPQADALRSALREQGMTILVVKNSLAIRALRRVELVDVAELVDGPTAFVYGGADPVVLSKTLFAWSRKERVLEVRGGMVEGRAVDAAGVAGLAALPPLAALRAQVVGAIAWPLSGFAGALQGILRSFVGVVKAIAEKTEEQN